jgi:ABC-type transport system substrate-binding protein
MTETKKGDFAKTLSLRRRDVLAALAGVGALSVVGLPTRARAAAGGVLRVVANANPSSLDPTTGGAGSDHVFLYCFYDTLVEWDYATLAPRPGLAQSWKFTDPQTLVMSLRTDAMFHDGTPFDAAAVKFNLDRNRTATISNIKKDVANIAEVTVTNAHTVTITLSAPDTALPLILSDRAGMMVSPTALGGDPEANIDRAPVGTGPWAFASWSDGEKVSGTANPTHWREGIPKTSGIDLMVITESATAMRAVQSGQADIAYQLSERQKMLIEKMPNLQLISGPTLYIFQLYVNSARGPMQDVRIRRALSMAIDREAYVLATQAGVGEPAYMNLPSAHWAFAKDVSEYQTHNLERAQQLMKEAGVEGGIDLDFRGYTDQVNVQRQEVVLAQLAKINVSGRFTNGTIAETSSIFFGDQKQGDLLLSAWTGRPDPSLTYALLYGQSSYYNPGRVAPPAGYDEALAASRATQDQDERARHLAVCQKLAMDAVLSIPLSIRYEVNAAGKQVEGYRGNLLGKPKFTDVGLTA